MTWSKLMLRGAEGGGLGWFLPPLFAQSPSTGIRTVQYIVRMASSYQALTKYQLHIQKS